MDCKSFLHVPQQIRIKRVIHHSSTMAAREDNPIRLDAQEIISYLFHDGSRWHKLQQTKLIQTPSQAVQEDFIVEHCCEIRANLKEGFDHIFEHSHVKKFWEELAFQLKQTTGIRPVASRKRRNEEHLITSLIQPTLEKIVNSISIIPRKHTNGSTTQQLQGVSSHLVIQDEIKMGDASGRSPAVDATIQISDGNNICKVLIPVEVKVKTVLNHLYQIAAYMTKVSTAKELEKKVVIGIIMDTNNFNLVFSPYSYDDKSVKEPVPLPIVYVSPPITWRDSSPSGQILFSILPAALMVIACTCYFQLDRIECDQNNMDSQVLDIAHQLFQSRHVIKPILDDDDLFQALKQQQKIVQDLEKKIGKLERQLSHKQNGTPTSSLDSSISAGDLIKA